MDERDSQTGKLDTLPQCTLRAQGLHHAASVPSQLDQQASEDSRQVFPQGVAAAPQRSGSSELATSMLPLTSLTTAPSFASQSFVSPGRTTWDSQSVSSQTRLSSKALGDKRSLRQIASAARASQRVSRLGSALSLQKDSSASGGALPMHSHSLATQSAFTTVYHPSPGPAPQALSSPDGYTTGGGSTRTSQTAPGPAIGPLGMQVPGGPDASYQAGATVEEGGTVHSRRGSLMPPVGGENVEAASALHSLRSVPQLLTDKELEEALAVAKAQFVEPGPWDAPLGPPSPLMDHSLHAKGNHQYNASTHSVWAGASQVNYDKVMIEDDTMDDEWHTNRKVTPRKCTIGTSRVIKHIFWDVWGPTIATRLCWDMLMLLLLLYVVFVTPYIVAFGISTATFDNPVAVVDVCVNALFLLDVVLNFRTAYQDKDGRTNYNRKGIFVNYITGWFWVDTLTSLPWDNMFGDQFGVLKVLRILRLLRLLKAFKLLRMLRLAKVGWVRQTMVVVDKFFDNLLTRMCIFSLVAFSFVHWAACAFYYVARLYGPDYKTWITVITDQDEPLLTAESPNLNWYIFSIYWAVTTMTTVGYGDITGVQIGEKFVAIFSMVLGASIFAYFMASMATLVAALNNSNVRVTRKKALVSDFINTRKIPGRLSQRIRSYFEYVLERQLHSDEAQLIAELPSSLRRQIMWHLHREALEKVPFFAGKDSYFLTALVPYLKLEYYSPEDVIVRQGETGHEMFFIAEGTVEVRLYSDQLDAGSQHSRGDLARTTKARSIVNMLMRKKDRVQLLDEDLTNMSYKSICVLSAGQYFGEYTCFFGEPRVASVVATSFCELYSLSSHDVEQVMSDWPDLEADLSMLLNNNSTTWEADAYEARNRTNRVPSTAFQGYEADQNASNYNFNYPGNQPPATDVGAVSYPPKELTLDGSPVTSLEPTQHAKDAAKAVLASASVPLGLAAGAATKPAAADTATNPGIQAGAAAGAAKAEVHTAAPAGPEAPHKHHPPTLAHLQHSSTDVSQVLLQLQWVTKQLQALLPPGHHATVPHTATGTDPWPLLRQSLATGTTVNPLAGGSTGPLVPLGKQSGGKPGGLGSSGEPWPLFRPGGAGRPAGAGGGLSSARGREGESIRRGRLMAPAATPAVPAARGALETGVRGAQAAAGSAGGVQAKAGEVVRDSSPEHMVIAMMPIPERWVVEHEGVGQHPSATTGSPNTRHAGTAVVVPLPKQAGVWGDSGGDKSVRGGNKFPRAQVDAAAAVTPLGVRGGTPADFDPGANNGNPFARVSGVREGSVDGWAEGARSRQGSGHAEGPPLGTSTPLAPRADWPPDPATSGDALVTSLTQKLGGG